MHYVCTTEVCTQFYGNPTNIYSSGNTLTVPSLMLLTWLKTHHRATPRHRVTCSFTVKFRCPKLIWEYKAKIKLNKHGSLLYCALQKVWQHSSPFSQQGQCNISLLKKINYFAGNLHILLSFVSWSMAMTMLSYLTGLMEVTESCHHQVYKTFR